MKSAVITLVGGAAVGLVLLNLVLATPFGRGMVAKKVSGAMRLPVTVGAASYTPWGGVRLRDLRVEQVEAAQSIVDDPFFTAASFSADVKLLSLFREEVVIDRLVCDSPTISMVRGQEFSTGPGRERKAVVSGGGKSGGGSKPDEGDPAEKPARPVNEPEPPAKSNKRRSLALGELEIRSASLIYTSFGGAELIRIEGVKVTADLSNGNGQGRVTFDRAVLAGALEVTGFTSPIEIEGRRIMMADLAASCGGGSLGGELVVERRRNSVPFAAKLSAQGIDVAQLVDFGSLDVESAKIGGEIVLRGTAQSPETIVGGGVVRVESVVVDEGADFENLRRALEIGESGEVMLDTAQAKFSVGGGVLALERASFGSGNVLVKSVGTVLMGGGLNVSTRIYLRPELHGAVASKPVGAHGRLQFAQLEGTDWFFRDELLTGTVTDPRVDLWRTGEPAPVGEVVRDLKFDFDRSGDDAIGD